MNNLTVDSIRDSLTTASYQLNIWLGLLLWTIGNIGCIGNMLVYGSAKSRQQAYAIYLFASAIADFHYFNFVLLTRILQNGFTIILTNRYSIICKLRQFSTIWGNVVGFSLFSLATIDRLLSTHRSNTYRLWSHRLILYQIENGNCSPRSGFYSYYDNYFQVVFSSLLPAVSMSILAYLLIKNVRHVVRRRVVPSISVPQRKMINQIDSRLTLMLISESCIAVMTYVPYAVQLTYANVTQNLSKSPLRIAWENMFTELIHLLSYIFFVTSFYVSLLSNGAFRQKLKESLHIFGSHLHYNNDRTRTFLRRWNIISNDLVCACVYKPKTQNDSRHNRMGTILPIPIITFLVLFGIITVFLMFYHCCRFILIHEIFPVHGIDPDLVHAGVPIVIVRRSDQPKIYPPYIATSPAIYAKE
ncbi:unnamed protein product [Adineta ricciae]|uniref:G-protein coupled receptors family 1 profile domain-containing protein n=1 Tax=Adineta ricciae TaxID=249248 RepID=A0A815A869_ADIRI|nr:unnamed protein product [Adineta ricciae]